MIWFQRSEFECKCGCGMDTVDYELGKVLDDVRAFFGKPTTVNSGNRCVAYNELVQLEADPEYIPMSSDSMHLRSKAADISVEGISPETVYSYLNTKYPDTYGIGLYSTFVHIDVREAHARW